MYRWFFTMVNRTYRYRFTSVEKTAFKPAFSIARTALKPVLLCSLESIIGSRKNPLV